MAVPHLLLLIPAVLALFLLAALYVVCRPRPVKIPIKGRHVFITFASSGIGLAMARRATADGARVSILARVQAKLEAAREEIRRVTRVEVAIYSADVRDREVVKKAVEAAGTILLVLDALLRNGACCCMHGLFIQIISKMKGIATENFQRIREAYEILTDEHKRQIYDIYGMEGLTSGLELGPKLNKPEEIKEELERLRRQKEEEKVLAHARTTGSLLANLSVPQYVEGAGIIRGSQEDSREGIVLVSWSLFVGLGKDNKVQHKRQQRAPSQRL